MILKTTFRSILNLAINVSVMVCVSSLPISAYALGTETTAIENAANNDFASGKKAIDAKNWQTAVDAFEKVIAKDPKNADAHNYLGYANRHLNRMDASFRHYNEALRLDPAHRGAHEYIGQAYLKVGNLPKAQEHLAALKTICGVNCLEYKDLNAAITNYRPANQ